MMQGVTWVKNLQWKIQDFVEDGEYRKTTFVTEKYPDVSKIIEKRGIYSEEMYYIDELDQTRHKHVSQLVKGRARKAAEANEGVATLGRALERLRVAKERLALILARERELKSEIKRAEKHVERFRQCGYNGPGYAAAHGLCDDDSEKND